MNHEPKRYNDGADYGEVVELCPQFLKNAIFVVGESPHFQHNVQNFGITFLLLRLGKLTVSFGREDQFAHLAFELVKFGMEF